MYTCYRTVFILSIDFLSRFSSYLSFFFSNYDFSYFLFFFFQAEDGIRDYKVTGVQTCALPIWRSWAPSRRSHGPPSGPAPGQRLPLAPPWPRPLRSCRRRSAPALRPAGRPGPGSSPRCCCLRGRRWVSDAYSRTCSFLISGVRQGRRASQRGRIVVAARQVFELYARRLQLVARVEQVCTDGAQHALRIEHIENAALTEAVGGLGHAQGRLGLAHRTLAQCLGAQSCHLQLLPGLQRLLAQLDLPAFQLQTRALQLGGGLVDGAAVLVEQGDLDAHAHRVQAHVGLARLAVAQLHARPARSLGTVKPRLRTLDLRLELAQFGMLHGIDLAHVLDAQRVLQRHIQAEAHGQLACGQAAQRQLRLLGAQPCGLLLLARLDDFGIGLDDFVAGRLAAVHADADALMGLLQKAHRLLGGLDLD